jgi:hypothetical protein
VSAYPTRKERRTLMQAGVDQKVLDDAELIALVRQTQDQFEAHGELNACCASRKLPGSLDHSS